MARWTSNPHPMAEHRLPRPCRSRPQPDGSLQEDIRMSVDMIRVVLADDHAVVRAGLKAVMSVARDIEIIGEAKNGREAVALVERFKPDVVVMDLSMPELD